MGSAEDRLRYADRLVAVGALALLILLFFVDWYGGSVTGLLPGSHINGATVSSTGWEAFTASRWVWLLTGLVALASAFAIARGHRIDGPVQLSAIVAGLGTVSTALILYRIVHHPGPSVSGGGVRASYGIKLGIWLSLLAALAVTLGSYLRVQAEEAPPLEAPAEAKPEQAFSGLAVKGDAPVAPGAPTERGERQ